MTTTDNSIAALDELKSKPQWVCWCLEPSKANKDRLTKIPYNARTGYKASSTDSQTWSSHAVAVNAHENRKNVNGQAYDGIGFVFNEDMTGIDFDHCIDEDGTIDQWAQERIQHLDSYGETSPSKTGVHVLTHGLIPKTRNAKGEMVRQGKKVLIPGQQKGAAIEMYSVGRFFTVTGNHIDTTPPTIEDRQAETEELYAFMCSQAEKKPDVKPTPQPVNSSISPLDLSDTELQNKAESASNGTLFASLWRGDTSGHDGDHSVADQALCNLLAFWTGKDATRMDRLFRQSGLYRKDKWDRNARSGETYGQGTIARAIALCKEEYKGRQGYSAHEITIGLNTNTPRPALERVNVDFIKECYHNQEMGDADLFARLFRGKVIFDHTSQTWYMWRGHYWEEDRTGGVKYLVSGKLASAYLRATAGINEDAVARAARMTGTTDADKKERETVMEEADALVKGFQQRATTLRHASRCKNVLYYAIASDGMKTEKSRWDRDPWLLGVKNGVLDLRTGELRDGRPEDLITKASPTMWKGLMEPAPRWEQFLEEIFADRRPNEKQELIGFLQRILGYGITGMVNEHLFLVLWGADGRNGKDTISQAVAYALGRLSGVMHKDVLLATDKGHSAGAASPHLSDLQGKRLTWASEPEVGARFNIGQIKELSGGGEIPTRAPYERDITYINPSHLLILLTNHKPHADSNDKAFWERLRLIEFNMRFVDRPTRENERPKDAKLWETLKAEASGILAWLVRGCLLWQKEEKVTTPQCVFDAVKNYQDEEDTLALCFNDIAVFFEKARVSANDLYGAYKTWCFFGSMKPMSSTAFGTQFNKRLDDLGVTRVRTGSGYVYKGIGLSADRPGQVSQTYSTSDENVYSTIHESVGFDGNYTHPSKTASGACLTPTILPWSVGYVGSNLKDAHLMSHEGTNNKVSGQTIHPYTHGISEGSVGQPVKPVEDGVYGSQKPYTNTTTTLHNPTLTKQSNGGDENKPSVKKRELEGWQAIIPPVKSPGKRVMTVNGDGFLTGKEKTTPHGVMVSVLIGNIEEYYFQEMIRELPDRGETA